MRRKVTLKQLAEELKLSISTVSKSLKDDSEISQKTIDRVKALAKKHNYKPNALAVSLKSSKTKSIGVVIPDILNPFFAKALLGIEKEASKDGYKIVTCITNESYEKEIEYLDMLSYNGVDGFILAISQETQLKNRMEHFEEILKDDIPIVMFDRVSDDIYCDKVIVDDKNGSFNAFQHLVKQNNCKSIAVVSTIGGLSVTNLRIEGAKNAAKKYDKVKFHKLIMKKTTKAEERIEKFLSNHKIDGVLALDEIAAVSSINMARKIGLRVPKDIAILGFSDGGMARYTYPALTTVSQHAKRLGKAAAKILIDKLELRAKAYLPTTKIIKTTLTERAST